MAVMSAPLSSSPSRATRGSPEPNPHPAATFRARFWAPCLLKSIITMPTPAKTRPITWYTLTRLVSVASATGRSSANGLRVPAVLRRRRYGLSSDGFAHPEDARHPGQTRSPGCSDRPIAAARSPPQVGKGGLGRVLPLASADPVNLRHGQDVSTPLATTHSPEVPPGLFALRRLLNRPVDEARRIDA